MNTKFDKYVKRFWRIYISLILFLIVFFSCISLGLFGFMPSFEELENPKSSIASEVYTADSVLLGKYFIQNRSNSKYSELSEDVVNTLIATEDSRFKSHSGVDVRSITRVIFKNFLGGRRSAGGGSTISQQLAKNLFPRSQNPNFIKIVFIKFKEWITAIKLERNYTKEEILAMYLNTVDFGSQSFGIKSAAKTYFGKVPNKLNKEESALLIGLLKAPTYYSPIRNPERALKRRDVVLFQMKKYDYIEEREYDSLKKLPVDVSKYRIEDQNNGMATYLREYLRDYINQWCKNNINPVTGNIYNLYKDGLKIYTTINSKMQKYAEEAVAEHIGKSLQPAFFKHWKGFKNAPFDSELSKGKIDTIFTSAMKRTERYANLKKQDLSDEEIKKIFKTPVKMTVFTWKGDRDTTMSPMDSIKYYKYFLQTGFMSMEPKTGYVRAYVGGINYKHFKYDHVMVGKRQVGSTFKPFIYTLAMQEGEFSPCSRVPNLPVSFELGDGESWTPKNSSDVKEGEMVTLKWALANSVNYISAYLMKRYSPQAVIKITRKMGIKSPIDAVYSICLGTPDLSVYEMVGANSTFANKGQYVEPILITKILDKSGNILATFTPKKEEAISEETAYLMLTLMKGVVEWGTGARLRYRYQLNNPIAGKTGTTQNNSDGWFMGITPNLVSGVWVGCEDRSVHFRSTDLGQGATMALPIWALYMKKVYADKTLNVSQDDFEKPAKELSVEMDCSKYEEKSDNPNFDNTNY